LALDSNQKLQPEKSSQNCQIETRQLILVLKSNSQKRKKPTEKQQKILETDNTPETMLGCRQ